MYANQTVARRSLSKGAAQARRLLSNIRLSSIVTESTIELAITAQVKAATAEVDCYLGKLVIYAGERFYFVASKFTGRDGGNLYYVVIQRNGAWLCSTRDESAGRLMIDKVVAHRNERRLLHAC